MSGTPPKFSREQQIRRAEALWAEFDKNERFGCKFGLFPHTKMQAAEDEGYNGKQLSIDLMEIASMGVRQ